MTKRVPCPSCRANGQDSLGNHLHLFDHGKAGWCYKEQKVIRLEEDNLEQRQYQKKSDELDIRIYSKLPCRALDDRGISKEIAERFGVKVSVDETTGEVDAHYYPYHDQDGNVTGWKKRQLPKQFSVVGKIKGLFGQKQCKKDAKFLVIVSGECDAMAAYQMLQEQGKNYNVVSIPNGDNEQGKVGQDVLRELEWITAHGSIALCLDQDKSGQAYAKSLADMLASQCKVAIVKMPHKDANEMLKRGMSKEFLKCLFDSKPYRPEQVIEGHEIPLERIRKPKPPGIELPYPKLQRMLYGLRKGEITLVCSGSGIGKSTWAREVSYYLTCSGFKIALIALETPMDDVARMFVAIDNNIPPHKLMFNPNAISEEAYTESYNKLLKTDQLNFFEHWGSIAADELIRKCQYYVKALGVDFIVLDHISMVVAGSGSTDERKDIDVLFENLTKLVVETGVGVLAVMHLKRVQGKSFNKGGEVELTDLRGSSGAECMSWNVIGLERDQQGDQKDILKIRLLKNRTIGFLGLADTLIYNHETGRLLPLEDDY